MNAVLTLDQAEDLDRELRAKKREVLTEMLAGGHASKGVPLDSKGYPLALSGLLEDLEADRKALGKVIKVLRAEAGVLTPHDMVLKAILGG